MSKFEICFKDELEAENEQEVIEWLLQYLNDCDRNGDVSAFVRSVYETDPRKVWSLVEGDDGNLYISSGYHIVNRLNYFITHNPCELEYEEAPYYIFEEEEEDA